MPAAPSGARPDSPLGAVGTAYSASATAWLAGPARIYDRLAEVLVAASPVPLAGRLVVDVGAGTGAASRAVRAAGGRPVAVDLSAGMLAASDAPTAAVADARALPVRDRGADAVVAAFSLNHLQDPQRGLTEIARVVAPGGPVLVSSYADDDTHPVKAAVQAAAATHGWTAPAWSTEVREQAAPQLATPASAVAVAAAAGLAARAWVQAVPFEDLDMDDLVRWRLGMADLAPFVAGLPVAEREELHRRATALLGSDCPGLVRRMVVLVAVAG